MMPSMKGMVIINCIIIIVGLITFVNCGCTERNFCCFGRNLSCVSTENGNFRTPNEIEVETFSHQRQTRIKRRNDQKSTFNRNFLKNTKATADNSNDKNNDQREIGFKPVSFEPDFTSSEDLRNDEELVVAHFGLFDEPKHDEHENAVDNVEYHGIDKEIRYVIINDKLSKEKVGHLKDYHTFPRDKNEKCYCDELCKKASDCCSDYDTFCPAVDCRVTAWSEWTQCQPSGPIRRGSQTKCGAGASQRFRSIVNENKNGGAVCPHVLETKACFKVDDSCSGRDDVALLLPYNFGASRVPGLRNKTYTDLPKDVYKYKQLKTSCSVFRSIWFNNCGEETVQTVFVPDTHICVECQPTAYLPHGKDLCKGEGVSKTITHWSLINVKTCFGQWMHVEKQMNCKCDKMYPTVYRFVFV